MSFILDRLTIKDFKRIEEISLDLAPITALVGSNTSGKSSALQAAQLGISVLQAAFNGIKRSGEPNFARTVANDAVLFRPTERLLDMRHDSPATQDVGFSMRYEGTYQKSGETKWVEVTIRRGKNANISVTYDGNDGLAVLLADPDEPFSIFTPGLSGIPVREEWRTKGAMDAAVMHGDANLYLRTVLDHLFNDELDGAAKDDWIRNRSIDLLPDCGWKTFSQLLDRCFDGARIVINHNPDHDRYVSVRVSYKGAEVTLDLASTGMLQVVQILAYSCFYRPPLLLLDEPDAHLHADSQSRLFEALRGVVRETHTRILFATHSPQLIQRMIDDNSVKLIWMEDGAEVDLDKKKLPAVPILMSLGALSVGSLIFDPKRKQILLSEDEDASLARQLALTNGASKNLAVLSYNGCGNLQGARLLAVQLSEVRPDATIVIHRDRDFRTMQEVEFELALSRDFYSRQSVDRVTEIFTPLNDVEHSYAQPKHLHSTLSEHLLLTDIDDLVNREIALRRDDFINEIRVARQKVSDSIYASERKMKKNLRTQSGVPDTAPNVRDFLPVNGETPVDFRLCHGSVAQIA